MSPREGDVSEGSTGMGGMGSGAGREDGEESTSNHPEAEPGEGYGAETGSVQDGGRDET